MEGGRKSRQGIKGENVRAKKGDEDTNECKRINMGRRREEEGK